MILDYLEARSVRNIRELSMTFDRGVNILNGLNGSGKTNIIEAIHLLGTGKGFRSQKQQSIIAQDQQECIVFGQVAAESDRRFSMGVSRGFNGKREYRIGGETCKRATDLAEALPLLLVAPETLSFLNSTPQARRQFMNWGVFHVEPQFVQAWKTAQHCLQQRNALLKHDNIDAEQTLIWTAQYVAAAEQVHKNIESYLAELSPLFGTMVDRTLGPIDLELRYIPGWYQSESLSAAIAGNEQQDRTRGYTRFGHHRSDLKLLLEGKEAVDILSRGQLKVVAVIMLVSQAILLKRSAGKTCVLLMDDLGSELDKIHRSRLARLILELESQVIFTAIESEWAQDFWSDTTTTMFHVEQGEVSLVY